MIEKDIFLDNNPVYNKHFKKKLNKRDLLGTILSISENLTLGYRLKKMYLKLKKEVIENDCEEWFDSILNAFIHADLSEYSGFIITLKNWRTEMLNSFKRPVNVRKMVCLIL